MNFRKYLRITLKALKSGFLTSWEYKTDFYASIIIQIVYFGVLYLFYNIVFNHIVTLSGWTLGELMLLVFVNDVGISLFGATGLRFYSEYIVSGQLNTKLIKPANTLFLIAIEQITMAELLFAIMDILFVIITIIIFNIKFSAFFAILGIIQFVISLPLLITPYLMINALAFFFGDTEGLYSMYNSVLFSIREYPMSILNKFFIILFSIIAPSTLLHLFMPTLIALNKISIGWTIITMISTIVLDIITIYLFYILFKKGLRNYEGVG